MEDLGIGINCLCLSGVYYHSAFDSQTFIFRCDLAYQKLIKLSDKHSEYKFVSLDNLSSVQKIRVQDYLEYFGAVISGRS
ncbi:MAG: 8-oxo-dGTP diphosphatase [Arenicella sp.]|jgi:8-oxo-dGTP diphosphatase